MLIDNLATENVHRGGVAVQFTAQAIRALSWQDWPGNIRELANLVERMAILNPDSAVDLNDLPTEYRIDLPAENANPNEASVLPEEGELVSLKHHLQQVERELIEQALARAHGVVAEAARILNVGRTTLVEKIRKYGLSAESDRVA